MKTSILVVDDDLDSGTLLCDGLRRRGYAVEAVASASDALAHVARAEVDVVVTDVNLGGMSGLELCTQLQASHPEMLAIVVTGQGSMDMAIDAIRAGAYDFITKPISLATLAMAIERAASHQALRREVRRLRVAVDATQSIDAIIGDSPAVRHITELVRQVADSDATVLVTGESGTGKELVARAVHTLSSRRDQPFIAVNCAAMPAALLESELFGHVRGAFTDAKRSRPGLFAQAGTGTLFLDEIGEMPLEMQVKLLRVLQERTVRPVGGDEELPFEARLVTATNRDLEVEIAEKRFRADLFYRINVVQIPVPPLRDRPGDVLILAQHFVQKIASRTGKAVVGFSPEVARRLVDYDWPGNVRELENCLERAIALARLSELTIDELPEKIRAHQSARVVLSTDGPAELITLEELERRYVRQVLAAAGGNKTHAAKILGIDRRSLYRRIDTRSAALPSGNGAG